MRIGFIGLGNLGEHLASSLLRAGYPLSVHDLDPTHARPLLDGGAGWADSPAAAARAADCVITCLPSPAAVNAVVDGEAGILAAMNPGATWIDMSTNDRHELLRLTELAATRGIGCLEAPVTGGVHRAASGEITLLVGGETALFEAHRGVFETLGGEVIHMGPLGSATVIKVITNMLAFIHLVAAGEALMLAKQGGLDLASSFRAIRASSGNSFVHETESQVILNGSYDIGFTLDLACKDLGLATELGESFQVPLALASRVAEMFREARTRYGGDAWSPRVVQLLEEAVGTELRAAGFPASLMPRDR